MQYDFLVCRINQMSTFNLILNYQNEKNIFLEIWISYITLLFHVASKTAEYWGSKHLIRFLGE